MTNIALTAALAAILVSLAGCAGYQLGPDAIYRSGVQTVFVPVFESDSFQPNLGERLTEAVIKEIEGQTPYKVVSAPNADSVLTGRILRDQKRTLSETVNDDPRQVEVGLLAQVQWVDRRGDALSGPFTCPLPPVLVAINQTETLVPEAGQSKEVAQQRAIQRLAKQIVAQMEAPW